MGHFTAKTAGAGDTDPNETRISRIDANFGRVFAGGRGWDNQYQELTKMTRCYCPFMAIASGIVSTAPGDGVVWEKNLAAGIAGSGD